MKKLFCILLAVLLLTGCGAPAAQTQSTTQASTQVSAVLDGTEVVFQPLEKAAALPAEGCWYLTSDVTLTEKVTVTGQLKLHLNGFAIRGAEATQFGNLFEVPAGGELVIYDEEDSTGAVIAPRAFTAEPYVLHMFHVAGTVTIAGGTVDASALSLENISNGAGFYVADGGVVNVQGGTVTGGSALCFSLDPTKNIPIDSEPADTPTEGETEPTEAATEPTATEPTATEPTEPAQELELFGKGGTVYVAPGGTLNLSGGTIRGGSAGLGGNIYLEEDAEKPAVMNMTGGTVLGGEVLFHGGNIYNAGVMNVSGGEIAEGLAYNHGGNIVVVGTLEMTAGTIRAGRCDAGALAGKRGGNILVNGVNAVVHIANAQIIDGDGHGGENFGGNISVIGQCAKEFSIVDSVISGGLGHRGGNLYFGTLAKDVSPENLDFYMKNVTVSGGSASYRGANLCMDSDLKDIFVELVMDNCTIICDDPGRETVSLGAGAAADTWVTLTMNGGAIQGGTLTVYGLATLTANATELTTQEHGGLGQIVVNP